MRTWQAIRQRLEMLALHGPNPNLDAFKLLRHTGGREIWELRAGRRPAYRLLFVRLPNEEAFLVTSVVKKDEMEKDSQRRIDVAVDRLEEWIRRHSYGQGSNIRRVDRRDRGDT